MNLYLLDISGPTLLALLIIGAFIVLLLAEAVVMLLFKIGSFGKCLLYSLMANFGSFLLGVLIFLILNKQEFDGISQLTELGVLYIVVSIFEAWIVKLLVPAKSWGIILLASFVMNLLTFGTAYLFVTMNMVI